MSFSPKRLGEFLRQIVSCTHFCDTLGYAGGTAWMLGLASHLFQTLPDQKQLESPCKSHSFRSLSVPTVAQGWWQCLPEHSRSEPSSRPLMILVLPSKAFPSLELSFLISKMLVVGEEGLGSQSEVLTSWDSARYQQYEDGWFLTKLIKSSREEPVSPGWEASELQMRNARRWGSPLESPIN